MRLAEHPWCTYLPDGLLMPEDSDYLLLTTKEEGPRTIDDYFIPIEAKCINMMWKHDNLLAKYMPQLQHAMRITKSPYCIFSVLYLNTKYEWTKVEYDPPYDDALFEKEKTFQL